MKPNNKSLRIIKKGILASKVQSRVHWLGAFKKKARRMRNQILSRLVRKAEK